MTFCKQEQITKHTSTVNISPMVHFPSSTTTICCIYTILPFLILPPQVLCFCPLATCRLQLQMVKGSATAISQVFTGEYSFIRLTSLTSGSFFHSGSSQ